MKSKYPWDKLEMGDYFEIDCDKKRRERKRIISSITGCRAYAQRVLGRFFATRISGNTLTVVRVERPRPCRGIREKLQPKGHFHGRFTVEWKYPPQPEVAITPASNSTRITPQQRKQSDLAKMVESISTRKPQEAVQIYREFCQWREKA